MPSVGPLAHVPQHLGPRQLFLGARSRRVALELPAQAHEQSRHEVIQGIDHVARLDPVAPRGVRGGDEGHREQVGKEAGRLAARQRTQGHLPLAKGRDLGPPLLRQSRQRGEVRRDAPDRDQLLFGGGDRLPGGQPEVGGQPRRGLGLARPRLVEPDPGQPHGRLQPQHVAFGDAGGVLGQPVLRRLQGALQPVDRLGEEAVGVARQEVALVDPRHLERHVGPLHARLCFARAQPMRGGLLARRDLAERVQRLDDAEVPHEGGRQVGEPEASVLLLDGLRGRSGDQRGLQRRAHAGVQRDNRPAGRVHLAALRLQHGLLGAGGGDPGILRQRGAHRRPPVQRAGPGA